MLPFRGGALAGAVASEVERAAGSVTLVGHPGLGDSGIHSIADRHPGEGPLGGILTALHDTSADWSLIVACDMPALSAEFLTRLITAARQSSADIVLPYGADGRPEPLCAVYHRRALEPLQAHFDRGIRKVTAAMQGLTVERLDIAETGVFQNVNTPEDWSGYAAE